MKPDDEEIEVEDRIGIKLMTSPPLPFLAEPAVKVEDDGAAEVKVEFRESAVYVGEVVSEIRAGIFFNCDGIYSSLLMTGSTVGPMGNRTCLTGSSLL